MMRVTSAADISLNFRTWGTTTPRVLFIHGFGDTSFVWDAIARRIEPQLSAVGIDLRGHGDSTWHPRHDYRTAAHAADVTYLVKHLQLSDLTIVGHSLGASVAIHVVNAIPDLVSKMVLVDGGPELNAETLDYIYDLFRSQPFHYERVADYVDALALRTPLAERSTLEAFAREALKSDRSGGFVLKCDPALFLAPRQQSPELWPLLQSVRCPVLIARGRASAVLTAAAARRMTRVLYTSELVSIPTAGHAVMLDNPAALARELLAFLRAQPPILDAKRCTSISR
jgi:pimeloyl-ACP methyl ester carboxylesterase